MDRNEAQADDDRTQAIGIVLAGQLGEWLDGPNPPIAEAIAAVRDNLAVGNLTNYGDGGYEAYKLVLEASDEQIGAALAGYRQGNDGRAGSRLPAGRAG